MTPRCGVLGLALSLLAAAPAVAQPPSRATDLSLDAPPGCPSASVLGDEIASLVGRAPADIALPSDLDPRVRITRAGSHFELVVVDGGAERTLRDRSCAALVRAAALIVALRVDADAATLSAATAAEASLSPAAEAPVPPPVVASPVVDRARRLGDPRAPLELPPLSLGVGGMIEAGVVPAVSGSVAADVVVRVDRFETRVRGAYVLEQAQAATPGAAASALVVTVLACGRPFDASFAIAFCGGVEGGPLFVRSYGVAVPGAGTGWAGSVVAGAWLPLFPWHDVDVSLGAELFVRLARPELAVEGLGVVWSSDVFGGRFGLLVHLSP